MPYLLLLALLALPLPALAIYKCESGGKTSYSDQPCVGTEIIHRSERIIIPPAPSDTYVARENLIREKRILQAIETQRRKEEANAEKERRKFYKEQERKTKRCAMLEQRT